MWFKVWEADCSNYQGCHPWFFGGDNPQPLALMMDHWEATYGLGHNYILNMPPSKDGIITPKMAASAEAFGRERHRRYGVGSSDPSMRSPCELARATGVVKKGETLVVALPGGPQTYFDRIFLSEDDLVVRGQLVAQYALEVCRPCISHTGNPTSGLTGGLGRVSGLRWGGMGGGLHLVGHGGEQHVEPQRRSNHRHSPHRHCQRHRWLRSGPTG